MDPPPIAVRVAGDSQLIVVRGVVERDGAREIDYLVRHGPSETELIIDLSETEEITGALIGALLRASRRLAWRNRRLKIVCPQAELRGRLVIAGLDELADGSASVDDA